jgi:hypothetical protein
MFVTCLAGLAVRWTVRDTVPGRLATFHYMTPLVLVAAGCLTAAALFAARGRRRIACVALALGIGGGIGWWQACCFSGGSAALTGGPPMEVVFWNAARGMYGWDGVRETVGRFDAPLIGLVESGPQDADHRRLWRLRCRRHRAVYCGHQILLLVRGEVLRVEYGPLGRHAWYGLAEVVVDGRRLTAVVVDVTSKLEVHRAEPLARVARLIEPLARGPVVVMGDFNTPTDSPHFAGIRERYRNAFEEAGRGTSATWPVPVPVLALDQVWLSGAVAARGAEHVSYRWSDHRAVRTALVFPKGNTPRPEPGPNPGGSGGECHPVLITGRQPESP